jgi:hypothetical protein
VIFVHYNHRIARNIGNFETWSTYQGCDQVSYSDIPNDLKADVDQIFDVTGKMPISWTDKVIPTASPLVSRDKSLNIITPLNRVQRHTNYLSSSHLQSFWYLFKMLLNYVQVYSLTVSVLKPAQRSSPRSVSCLSLGNGSGACVNLRRNGQKRTLLRMCMLDIYEHEKYSYPIIIVAGTI